MPPGGSHLLYEPAVLGVALNEVFVPILQKQFPEIVDFYLPPEGCSYRLAVVSMKKQYPGHAKRVMFGVWSFLRQFMYTKFVIVTDDDVDVRDWNDVIWAMTTRMDPVRDTTLVENMAPVRRTRAAAPGSESTVVVALDLAFGGAGALVRVAGELVETRLRELLPGARTRVFRPYVPGRFLLIVEVSAEGPLHRVETMVREVWPEVTAGIDDDELARCLADIIQFDRFHSLTNAYEVLKSRGLEVIRSDELRLALGQYYDGHVQEIPSHNADIRHAFFETWEPVLHSEFDVFKWQKEARPLNSEAFLANPRYRVILKIQRDNHDGTGDRIEEMLEFNRQVQRLVGTELAE